MNSNEIESYRKAGKIAAEAVKFGKSLVKKNMLLIEIAEKIEGKIIDLGGDIAFPINISLDEIAAHYTPSLHDDKKAEGLITIDLGVSIDGFIADTAFSLDLTEDKRYSEMIKLNEEALDFCLKNLKTDAKVKDVGFLISSKIKGTKYSLISNLSGHSLEKDIIHAGLTIPNYENSIDFELKGIAFAIEPFLTEGTGEVYEGKLSEIFMLENEIQVRDPDARKLIKFIKENYKTRPFCKRWVEKAGFKKLDFLLPLLTKQKIFHNFPVLIEKSKMPVSQFEHTVLITDKVEVVTR